MSFQGFAREERFSDNQIRIDIGAVIENDLAEANRQTKYLGRNADLEGQWGNMYLNKLISKHEVEKRNREENFAFFMKNREEINKIVQYNNKIKYEDAGVNRHVKGLDSILGEGLLKLAVNVGSAAIGKAFADENERLGKAKAAQRADTINTMSGIELAASPEQKKAIKEGYFKNHRDWSEAEQLAKLAYFNAIGDYKAAPEALASIHRTNGLTSLDRQIAAYSPQNVALKLDPFARDTVHSINGRDVSYHDLPTVNKKTFDEWWARTQNDFIKSISPEGGLGGTALNNVITVFKQVQGQHANKRDTQAYRQAVQDNKEQDLHALERMDTAGERVAYLFTPNKGWQAHNNGGHNAAWNFAEEFFKDRSASEILEFMNAETGPNGEKLVDSDSARSNRFRKLIQDAQVREARGWQSVDTAMSNQARKLQADIENGVIPLDTLRNWAHNLGFDQHPINQLMRKLPTTQRNAITSAIRIATGQDPNTQAVSTAVSPVDKAFTRTDKKQMVMSTALSALPSNSLGEPLVLKSLKDNPWRFNSVLDVWLGDMKSKYDPNNEWNETQFRAFIANKIGDDSDPDYKQLQAVFTPVVTVLDPQTKKPVPAKEASWPGVEKAIKDNQPTATGMSQINRHLSGKSAGDLGVIEKITSDQTVIEALTPFFSLLAKAQKANLDLQPILARTPTALVHLGQRTVNGDSTQWINYFIRDHFTDVKPLSGDLLFTPEEAAAANSQITGYTRMSKVQQNHMSNKANNNQQPYTPNASAAPFYARHKSKEVNNIRNTLPNGRLQANHLTSITGANGVPIQVHTSVQPHLAQMIAAAKAAGVNLSFVSGYRSYADQEYLHRTKPKGIAAAPGTSDHGWGMAIDLNRYSGNWEKTYSWLIKNMTKYGFAMIGPDAGFGALGLPGGVWNDESWHLAFTGRFNRGTA